MKTNQEVMDMMRSFVEKSYDPKEMMLPMWTLIAEDGTVIPIMTPFTNDTEKEITSLIIKKLVKENHGVRLGFLSETWMVSQAEAPELTHENAKDIVPSEHPQRREGILLLVEDKFGKHLSGWYEIKRDDKGNGSLSPFRSGIFDNVSGRFGEMFGKVEALH